MKKKMKNQWRMSVWPKPVYTCIQTDQEKIGWHQLYLNKRGNITTDPLDINIITRKYHEQLFANDFVKLEGMDKLHERYKLPKLTKKNRNLNSSISVN